VTKKVMMERLEVIRNVVPKKVSCHAKIYRNWKCFPVLLQIWMKHRWNREHIMILHWYYQNVKTRSQRIYERISSSTNCNETFNIQFILRWNLSDMGKWGINFALKPEYGDFQSYSWSFHPNELTKNAISDTQ